MTNIRSLPTRNKPRWERDDVLQRLSESDIQAIYRQLGVERFKPGGTDDWKAFVPWRNNIHDEAMTIRKVDGVWSDKALGEGGSIFDAVERAGQAVGLDAAITWVAEYMGMVPPQAAGKTLGRQMYVYTDASGAPLYGAEREDYVDSDGVIQKTFRQKRYVAGEWVPGGPSETEKVLYNLPLLADAENARATVFIVEGEKCADTAVRSLGVLATCVVGGSNGWADKYAYQLAARDVVILPDADDPGHKFAETAAESLAPRVRSLKVINLPGLGPRAKSGGKDIVDWIEQGHGYDDLMAVVAAAEPYIPPVPKTMMVSLWQLFQNPPVRPAQLINKVWEPDSFGMIAAHAKSFKGFFVADFIASLASGANFLGHPEFTVPSPVKVVYWFEEGNDWDVLRRLTRWCAARGVEPGDWMENIQLVYGQGLRLTNEDGFNKLRSEIEGFAPQVVICDTLARAAAGLDENTSQDMGLVIDALDSIKRDYRTAALYVHHRNKAGGYRGHSSLYAACDCIVELDRPDMHAFHATVDFELKSGHQADRIEVELVDDLDRNGALFVTKGLPPSRTSKGSIPGHADVCRFIHRHGNCPETTIKKAYYLSHDAFSELRQQLLDLGLVASFTPPTANGRRPVCLNLMEKGLELIGVLGDD